MIPAIALHAIVVPQTPTPSPTMSSAPTQPTAAPSPASFRTLKDLPTGLYARVRSPNEIVSLHTTLIVPEKPPATGTLFLWPGLQPVDGPNFHPIGNGVLQPVLTWGPSCAPGKHPPLYSTWWVAALYVNSYGIEPGFTGCQGGAIMPVEVGDRLSESLTLDGTTWRQNVIDLRTGSSVSYAIDLRGQQQQIAYFLIEGYQQNPIDAVTFVDTSLTFAQPPIGGCSLRLARTPDADDRFAPPVASNDGRTCSFATITIYSPQAAIPLP